MRAEEIKAGGVYAVRIGRNEAKVKTVKEEPGKGWKVESLSTGSSFTVQASRFLRCLEQPPAAPQTETAQLAAAKRMSMLDAAAEVLKSSGMPMSSGAMISAMETAELWKSPKGRTPKNTLTAAIIREMATKENPRFRRAGKGLFEYARQEGSTNA